MDITKLISDPIGCEISFVDPNWRSFVLQISCLWDHVP